MPCPTKKCPVCKPYNPNPSFEEVFIHLNMNGKASNAIRTIGIGGTKVWAEDKKPNWSWENCFWFETEEEAQNMYEKLQGEHKE